MNSGTVMLEVSHVRKTFSDEAGAFDALRDVSFTLSRGEMVALLGISGAGKTTLLQILGGLDTPTAGEVTFDGAGIAGLSSFELAAFRNRKIGFVFQFHHLLPDFSAVENVMMPGLFAGKSRAWCEKRARELLAAFGLERCAGRHPTELSGGERQRAALARALVNDPALILADEPTGNLDRRNGEILLDYFHRANRELGQTFLIATHNGRLTAGLHRTMTLEDGVIVEGNSDVKAPQ
jgi:lipoprotein-releasing system ATP-binding protein